MSSVLASIKITLEDELRERLGSHPIYKKRIAPLFEPTKADLGLDGHLREHLRSGIELVPATHPALFAMIERVQVRLGVKANLRVFKLRQGGGPENASIVSDGNAALLSFEDGILNALPDQALECVIGHEFGHFGFLHPIDPIASAVAAAVGAIETAGQGGMDRADTKEMSALAAEPRFDEVLRLYYLLSQLRELNADRAGLVALPDFEAAALGGIILSAGPLDRFGSYDVAEYVRQGQELVVRDDVFDEEDAWRTHPIEPLRTLALNHFFRSDLFRSVTGVGSADTTLSGFAELLPRVVPLGPVAQPVTRPATPATAKTATAPARAELSDEDIATLTFLCVQRVVCADGNVSAAERRFLVQRIRPAALYGAVLDRVGAMGEEAQEAELTRLVALARGWAPRSRTNLVKTMIAAARADRRLHDGELAVVVDLGGKLGVADAAERLVKQTWGAR
jgi:Zn-dependent protease with chaperone function/uncharacterized tellurite resistance protein B-like protein